MNSNELGNRLYRLRNLRGMEQEELALKAGVSQSLISKIEKGKANPSLNTLDKLAAALGVTREHFFEQDSIVVSLDDPQLYKHLPDDIKRLIAKEDSTPYLEFVKDLYEDKMTVEDIDALRKVIFSRKRS